MSSDPKDQEATSIIGISVCVETMEDGSEKVGLLIHTQNVENAFMLRMPSGQARTLAANIELAVQSIEDGVPKGAGYQ